MRRNVVVIGGGAAGFFAAIACAEKNPSYSISILEQAPRLLQKVKISGGGRCNVTHACYDPKLLVKNYPRGEKQLLGPFTRFNTTDTVRWFESRGVKLKTEPDGRMFPVTDSSQTIIDCLVQQARKHGVKIETQAGVDDLQVADSKWQVRTSGGEVISADVVIAASGSSWRMWNILQKLGHTVVAPVPSLFTFNIKDERIKGLEGLSVRHIRATVNNRGTAQLSAEGALLITHWGLSGPVILRLSACGARVLAQVNHRFEVEVNWVNKSSLEIIEGVKKLRQAYPKKNVAANPLFEVPKRLWERLVKSSRAGGAVNFAELSNEQIEGLAAALTGSRFSVSGKSTFKEEFVTAGGIDLKEVDFKTMQSKKLRGLYFAGEALDIDAITGGFNFQAAWTTGWIAGSSV